MLYLHNIENIMKYIYMYSIKYKFYVYMRYIKEYIYITIIFLHTKSIEKNTFIFYLNVYYI